MKLDLEQIVLAVSGTPSPAGIRGTVSGISTDSRTIERGDLFIPLRGKNFDGHDFLIQAVRQGATACLSEEVIAGLPVSVIRVADTLHALGDLAAFVRRGFAGPVAAITGSSGKTTTKEMLAAILALTGPGLRTEGNLNNLVGLPQTLFRLDPSHRWAVLEMGMSTRGEIARLAEIAAPQVGVITNVGPAHLETLHGLEGVARAKGELFAALPVDGTAVINADDRRVSTLPVANGVRRLSFGLSPAAEVRAERVQTAADGISFHLVLPGGSYPVRLAVLGRHQVSNALAAAAAATALAIPGETIVRGLAEFRSGEGRMAAMTLSEGVLLLDDTYNANPLSVKAALAVLDEIGGRGRRIAVLGDMLELGPEAAAWHREVGREAACRADYLLVMGDLAGEVAAGAREGGLLPERIHQVSTHGQAVDLLLRMLLPGDRVLVKGSRGMKMENVCAGLRESDLSAAAG